MTAPAPLSADAPTTAFFASTASGAAASARARAVVWSGLEDELSSPPPSDLLTTITTRDLALLRSLRVVSGSYVVASCKGREHVARLVLARGGVASAVDAEATVTLPPLLAFNLGVPLHAPKGRKQVVTQITIRAAQLQEIGLVGNAADKASAATVPLRRLGEQTPALAKKAVIAPLLVSSLACRDHSVMQQPDGLLDSIRSHFLTPQVLQVGDIFAITLREATSISREAAPFASIAIPRSAVAHGSDQETQVHDAIVVPPLQVDTSVVFFRVESLDSADAESKTLALSVSSDTELLQIGSVSAAAPDETTVKHYLESWSSASAGQSSSSLHTPALDQLYEMLQPSQLCDIPVSVLLAGPGGVGKSTLVHDVAKQLGVSVVEVPFAELLTAGQSELHLVQNMREQVAKAQALAPCILYISRFFAIDKHDDEAELRLAGALSECLRSLNGPPSKMPNIPLVACVEDITEVPKFVRQCFLYELPVEVPDQKARLAFLQEVVKTVNLSPEIDLAEVAQKTAGRTCGELAALMTDAGARAVQRMGSLTTSLSGSLLDQLVAAASGSEQDLASEFGINPEDLDAALKFQQSQASAAKMGGAASIPNVKWEDVGGLDDVKDEILDVVQLPIKHPELFASGVRQRSGILLYGPPGTGKTLLAKAIATECNMNFLSVKGPELLNMYIGESEKNVRQVFAKARSCRPCVLFFDELDSLAPMRGRGSDSGGVMDRVVSQLLTEIDGLSGGGSSGQDQVFVIGATNRPDLIESGLLRPGRFDRLLYLGICTEKPAQLKVVQALTRKFTLAEDVDLNEVVATCPLNFTGADFYALCSGALAAALKERVEELDRQLEELNAEDCYSSTPVTARVLLNRLSPDELNVRVAQQHFLTSLSQVVPSVSPAEIRHYEKLRDQYSSRQPTN